MVNRRWGDVLLGHLLNHRWIRLENQSDRTESIGLVGINLMKSIGLDGFNPMKSIGLDEIYPMKSTVQDEIDLIAIRHHR